MSWRPVHHVFGFNQGTHQHHENQTVSGNGKELNSAKHSSHHQSLGLSAEKGERRERRAVSTGPSLSAKKLNDAENIGQCSQGRHFQLRN